jgi:hypothetical protein
MRQPLPIDDDIGRHRENIRPDRRNVPNFLQRLEDQNPVGAASREVSANRDRKSSHKGSIRRADRNNTKRAKAVAGWKRQLR